MLGRLSYYVKEKYTQIAPENYKNWFSTSLIASEPIFINETIIDQEQNLTDKNM